MAIIGVGGIVTRVHMPAYTNIDDIEIVAVCDILPDRARKFSYKERV